MISTSIYIKECLLVRLHEGAVKLGINESDLLSILLMKSRKLFSTSAVCGRTVRYQRGGDPAGCCIHHIDLNDTDYEIATSRRYIFKISVSFLFSLAIVCFLDSIIDDWENKRSGTKKTWKRYRTNYHYSGFSISHFHVFSAEFWQIPWPKGEENKR